MANMECEKIIDQVVDPNHLNDQCKQHIKGCKECAATIACLVWLKTKGSPTTDLKPSPAFLNKIENSVGIGSGTAVFSGKTVLAVALGLALAAAIATGLLLTGQSPAESLSGNTATGITADQTGEGLENAASAKNEFLNKQQSAPILKFSSPADDAD